MDIVKVEEVSRREHLDGIAECIWAVMAHCDSPHKVFFPVINDQASALCDCKERLWSEHKNDPNSHWVFVRDTSSDALRIIGTSQWRIYQSNPFPHGIPNIEATWWPKGEGRDFATEFVRQCLSPRATWMSRPHTGRFSCPIRHHFHACTECESANAQL